jgi:hypothetical protein
VVRWLVLTVRIAVELTAVAPDVRNAATAAAGSRTVTCTPVGWIRRPAVAVLGKVAAMVTPMRIGACCVSVGNEHV